MLWLILRNLAKGLQSVSPPHEQVPKVYFIQVSQLDSLKCGLQKSDHEIIC